MTTVSLTRCETYEREAIKAALQHVLEPLGGISSYVRPGQRVLLKPNLLSGHKPERRITTDPEIVYAVARLVLEAGGKPFIADSPGLESFKKVATKSGMDIVAEDLGVELVELTNPVSVSPPEGSLFKKLELASQALDADVVINLPKLKTHSQMLFTLGVKNLFGTVVAQRKAEWHYMVGVDRDTFASLHLDIYLTVKPSLTILDGIWGMEGLGPGNGDPRRLNLIAASKDAVALDVSICHLLNIPLRSFPQYREAVKRQIGETDIHQITFKGDHPESFAVSNFTAPELDSLRVMPKMFDWFTKRYLVSKPVQDEKTCIACGECAEICPAEAVQLEAKKLDFNYDECIRCYCCQEICPQAGIDFKKGWLVRLLNRFNR